MTRGGQLVSELERLLREPGCPACTYLTEAHEPIGPGQDAWMRALDLIDGRVTRDALAPTRESTTGIS
jgi:hypothetical protein